MQTHFSSHPENDEKGTVVRCPRSWLVPIRAAWNKQKRNEICECNSQDRHITMISEGCEHVICLPSDNVTLKIENTNCAKEPQYDSKPHCQRVFPRAQSTTKKQKKVAQSTVMAQAKSSVEKKTPRAQQSGSPYYQNPGRL